MTNAPVPSRLDGKLALVTGGSSGIGLEAAVALARLGAEVVIVARDARKGEASVRDIAARSGSAKVSLLMCDFSAQSSIRKLAADYRAAHARLDILVNNAGGVSKDRKVSVDGIEQTFAVNHLGYFLLTNLLLDLLESSAPARVVNVASTGHYRGDLEFDNLGYEKGGYSIMGAYQRSKLANVLFTRELARRLEGKGVSVTSLHPGVVATNIWAGAPGWAAPFLSLAKRIFMISPEEGGARVVFLATAADGAIRSGAYYDKNVERVPAKLAQDDALASRLWTESARLTGLAPGPA
jgi:NAD(P)-dependent dehydrogenase (short-subunit alcohol dehydrogenase family)